MEHLEEFTILSTVKSNKSHEIFAASCGNDAKLCNADNRHFSDKEFIDEILENNKSLELCRLGAHYQNGVDERATRKISESDRVMLLHARRLCPEEIPQLIWPFSLSHALHLHNHLNLEKME